MNEVISNRVDEAQSKIIGWYRDFHRHPEPGWTEFRTGSIVVRELTRLGYEVKYGPEVIEEGAMMGVPSEKVLKEKQEQAVEQGGDPEIIARMEGGKTGVVTTLDTGRPGPTLAFRVDMDANEVNEAQDESHRPFAEGFSSVNKGIMHACGHDAHTAIGLGLAEVLMGVKDQLAGRIKIIFQPAEEGVRGAKSMMEAGVVDDVDVLIGVHVGTLARKLGMVIAGGGGFLATTKLDATFRGESSHAGGKPEAGKNALLAGATAALNLHAISRHSSGTTRINVGTLMAGSGRNVIPDRAELKIETRGSETHLNEYVRERSLKILRGAADMYEVDLDVKEAGGALGGEVDEELVQKIAGIAEEVPGVTEIQPHGSVGGSEDFTYFMSKVQERGGQATFTLVGTDVKGGHHNPYFDLQEEALPLAVKLLAEAARQITGS